MTWWARALLVPYLVIVGLLVFTPSDGAGGHWLLVWLTDAAVSLGADRVVAFGVFEFALNVLMLVPLGILLPVATWRFGSQTLLPCAVAGLAVSLMIEFAQLFIAGRFSHPSDLLANTLGALLGALVVYGLTQVATRSSTV